MRDFAAPVAVTTNFSSYEITAPSLFRQPGSEHAFSASDAHRLCAANRDTGRSPWAGNDPCAQRPNDESRSAPSLALCAVRHSPSADTGSCSSV